MQFDHEFVVRGLILDKARSRAQGGLVGYVRRAMHGIVLSEAEIKRPRRLAAHRPA